MESMQVDEFNKYDHIINQFWSGIELPRTQRHFFLPFHKGHFQKYHEIELNMKYAALLGYKGGIPSQWVAGLKWKGSLKGKTVGIHAGCYGDVWEKKQWPHFEELVNRLLYNKYNVHQFGSKNERIWGQFDQPFELDAFDAICDYTDLTLKKTIKEIDKCDYFIANDSGLMHIADAIGVPTIAIFGPTLPVKNRPISKYSLTLQATDGAYPECVPCLYTPLFQECKYQKCLENITAEFVFEQFEKHRSELNALR